MRSHLRTVLICLLTLSLLWFFLRNADLPQVWREIRAARLDLLAGAVLFTAVTYIFRAIRWRYLLRPLGAGHFGVALRTTVIGFAAIFLLPARAGEVLRAYLLAREERVSATAVFATIVFERVLDLVAVLLLFGSFVLVFDPGMARVNAGMFGAIKAGGMVAAGLAVTALATVFVMAGHPERLTRLVGRLERFMPSRGAGLFSRLLRRFGEGLATIRQPGPLLAALAWSVPVWLSIAAGVWLVTVAFHIDLPYSGSFLLLALLVVGVMAPTPGGVGGFHAAYQIGTMTFYGATIDRAVGAAVVLHAVSFVPVTVVGIALMARAGLSLGRMRRLTETPAAVPELSVAAAGPEEGSAR